ncbi:MAG TPA: hypothetical protein VEA41_11720 [Salinarimonas sp.]|nr:hypothetical protein [Salinarimonas sp.]
MPQAPPPSRWQRLGWFVLLYAGSLAGFVAFVYGFRALIPR